MDLKSLEKNTFYLYWNFIRSTSMRKIDIRQYHVVKAGTPYISEGPPQLQNIMSIMEKNESYIWWLQPLSGSLQSQIASVSINNSFFALNLRLEKVIFRHIRLTKDFVNVELLEDGTKKLRIPARLLREKLRTAMRSQVFLLVICIKCI